MYRTGVPVWQETIYFYNYPNAVEIGNMWVIDRAVDIRLDRNDKKYILVFDLKIKLINVLR